MATPGIHHPARWLFTLLLALLLPASAFAERYAIFVHQSLPLEKVSSRDLARLFLSESVSLGSYRLHPVNLAEKDLKFSFYQALTSMPPEKVSFHFVESELRGEGSWPRVVFSELEVIKMIMVSRRVVGWMSWEKYQGLADSVRKNLRLVAVDDRLPDDPGYPITTQ